MGLFSNKKQSKQEPVEPEVVDIGKQVFDEQYREELRQAGREHFKKLLEESTIDLKQDIDDTMQHVALDLKEYMKRQLDLTISQVNSEITNQMNDRVSEFNRIVTESQNLVSQSLNQNAQTVHEKYQQLNSSLQQTISSQESMMASVFQDNKVRVTALQNEQDKALKQLSESTENTRHQAEQINQELQRNISHQSSLLNEIYQENLNRVIATRDAQAKSLETLDASAQTLQRQYQLMGQFLDQTVANQKAMLVDAINDNMARIIEHYLIGALGEQSDIKTQLPGIMQQLEENKQAMMDDMKL